MPDLNDPAVAMRDFSDDDESLPENEQRAIRTVGKLMRKQDREVAERIQGESEDRLVRERSAALTARDFFEEMKKREATDEDVLLPGRPDDGLDLKAEHEINQQHAALAADYEPYEAHELLDEARDEDVDVEDDVEDATEEVEPADEPTATPFADEVDPYAAQDALAAEMKSAMEQIDAVEDALGDLGADELDEEDAL